MNWPLWLELIVRSAALLLVGELLRRLSTAHSAAFRHQLLLWVMLSLSVLPFLAIALPELRLPLGTTNHPQTALVTTREISTAVLPATARHQPNWPLLIWLAGVFFCSAPVFIGALSARGIAHRATSFRASLPPHDAEILISNEVSTPLTCGLWHARILLPAAAQHWSPSRLEAVLLHELAHVRRRDVAAQVIAQLVAALWWFQPLVWFLRRNLRAESELACDAEALQSGLRPSAYAAELLAVAKTIGGPHYRLSSYTISMARASGLEHRVRAILAPASASFSLMNLCGFASALAIAAIAASALTLRPDQNSNEPGASLMKRTLLSGLLSAAGLSAATVSGSIHDPSGAPVAGATIAVFNPDTAARQQTTSTADGKFSLDGTGPGQYILRIEKPGFVSLFREFDLKADSSMDRQFTMTNEGAQPVADQVTPSADAQPRSIHVGGEAAQNNLIKKVTPVYPVAAKNDGTQGIVQIEATISKDGVPSELRVLSTPSADIAESSLEAVRQWRYRPTLLNGEPVEIVTTIIVHYTLAP